MAAISLWQDSPTPKKETNVRIHQEKESGAPAIVFSSTALELSVQYTNLGFITSASGSLNQAANRLKESVGTFGTTLMLGYQG